MNLQTIWTLAHKEMLEIWRDKIYFVMAFVFPFMLLNVLGFGLSFDVKHLPFAVVDYDQSSLSRDYIHQFRDSEYFDYKGSFKSEAEGTPLLQKGNIRFLLVVPPDFSKRLLQGQQTTTQAKIDGMFTYRAQLVKGYVAGTNAYFNQHLIQRWLIKHQGMTPRDIQTQLNLVTLDSRYLYNSALKSIWSIGSGIIMLIMLMAPAMLTALGVVREKETGSIYNIYASTVTSAEYITGKLLPYVGISLINLFILTWAVRLLFGVPFNGDPIVYWVSGLLYVTCAAGMGLFISTFVSSQAGAALIAMLGTMIPGMMYSGLMMPINSLGEAAQIQAHLFPAMYELQIVWGSFLKGQGWSALGMNILILGGYALLLWGLAIWRFKKRVKQ